MLLPRVLTAAVGIPLLLYLVHAGGLAWAGFTAAVCILCVYEYGFILAAGGRPVQRWMLLWGGGHRSGFLATIIRLRTVRVYATTFMCRIWRTRMWRRSRRSQGRTALSAISGTAEGSACRRLLPPCAG